MKINELNEIKELINLVVNNGITELEVSEEGKTIRINNNKASVNATAPLITDTSWQGLSLNDEKVEQKTATTTHTVKSPMVGTVYLSSAPGTKSFVEVGQQVKVGDTLCLIEAMKMFNRIEADKDGVITAKLIENAQPVEYGQALFIIT